MTMTPEQLKARYGTFRLSLLVLLAMMAMAFFGYQLAGYLQDTDNKQREAMAETKALLEEQNTALNTRVNQLEVALQLALQETRNERDIQSTLQDEIHNLRSRLDFYENVMAPETTQEGFYIDGVQIFATNTPYLYQLRFVLLQQRDNRAIVKGDLAISITGNLNNERVTLEAGSADFLPEGTIHYRFKFFQTVNVNFSLPEGFEPEFLHFETNVYQYTTLRGNYQRTISWRDSATQENMSSETSMQISLDNQSQREEGS
ncbi:DUF6776 family protein [Alteromonas sp. H39]|uniref:DUF6776 family protein n=1 Tax=Alteromonas sp. H39 TaxID=3389876 RepID=UPI0039E08762